MQVVITPIFLILAAIIGLLVGLLVSSLFSGRETKNAEPELPPQEMIKDGFVESARLWYSPAGKKVITQLDGGFYKEFKTLSPEQKSRINKLLDNWSGWAGRLSLTSENDDGRRQSTEGEDLPPVEPVLDWSVAEALKAEEQAESILLEETEKPATIAGQISLIIDKMLVDSPIKEKGIKLIENNSQGVDVWIGTEKFDGIDAIPYPEVKQLIRRAVTQWEKEMEAVKTTI